MLASLTLDVITTFVCNTGKTNHQMNKFITLYERIVSVDLRIYRAFFRTHGAVRVTSTTTSVGTSGSDGDGLSEAIPTG